MRRRNVCAPARRGIWTRVRHSWDERLLQLDLSAFTSLSLHLFFFFFPFLRFISRQVKRTLEAGWKLGPSYTHTSKKFPWNFPKCAEPNLKKKKEILKSYVVHTYLIHESCNDDAVCLFVIWLGQRARTAPKKRRQTKWETDESDRYHKILLSVYVSFERKTIRGLKNTQTKSSWTREMDIFYVYITDILVNKRRWKRKRKEEEEKQPIFVSPWLVCLPPPPTQFFFFPFPVSLRAVWLSDVVQHHNVTEYVSMYVLRGLYI